MSVIRVAATMSILASSNNEGQIDLMMGAGAMVLCRSLRVKFALFKHS